jgi:hypothetical protein
MGGTHFLISADYDPGIVGISVQPFAFRFISRAGPTRSHTPDVFLRLRGGDAVVVDVRPENLIDERAAEAFAATEALCLQVRWRYQRVGDQPPIRAANLRWLAGYRNDRNRESMIAERILDILGIDKFRYP